METENLALEEDPLEQIEINELCCERCGCTNIAAIKKGFSGSNAVIGYLVASVLGAIILAWGYGQNDFITL